MVFITPVMQPHDPGLHLLYNPDKGSRKNLAFVETLATDLKAAGLDVWYDLSGLGGGSRWSREIQKAIRESQYVLVVLSPDSVASIWVEEEILYARKLKRKIIPLFYKPCELPLGFHTLHFIDIQESKYKQNFNEILRALDVIPVSSRQQVISPKPLEKWKKQLAYALIGIVTILGCVGIIILLFQPPSFFEMLLATSTSASNLISTTTNGTIEAKLTQDAQSSSATQTVSTTSVPTPLGGGYGQIAFSSGRTGIPQIYLINVDGSDLHPITNLPEGACQPSWSPDGEKLVFVSPCLSHNDTYKGSSLYIINFDGSDLTPLDSEPDGDFDPDWSPDGTRIAFTSLRDGHKEIYVLVLSNMQETRLTEIEPDEENSQPAWSPYGNQIAFVKKRFGALQVWTMTDMGQNSIQVVRSGQQLWDYSPVWSPDGDIVFSQSQAGSPSLRWLMKVHYEDQNVQTVSHLNSELTGVEHASFSPDGLWIVYEDLDDNNNMDVYYMTISGATRTRLTTDPRNDFDPAWRPKQPTLSLQPTLLVRSRIECYCKEDNTIQASVITIPLNGTPPYIIPGFDFLDSQIFNVNIGDTLQITIESSDIPPLRWTGVIEVEYDPVSICEGAEP